MCCLCSCSTFLFQLDFWVPTSCTALKCLLRGCEWLCLVSRLRTTGCGEFFPYHSGTRLVILKPVRNFAVTMITPVAIDTIGYRYYIVYTCVGFCIPLSVYFLYPEVGYLIPPCLVFVRKLTFSRPRDEPSKTLTKCSVTVRVCCRASST